MFLWNRTPIVLGMIICPFLLTPPLSAQDTFQYDGGITWIFQQPSTSALKACHTISGDVNLHYHLPSTSFHAHIEGDNTPSQVGAAHILQQSNADAGSALDSRNEGRIQLSELYMTWSASPNTTLSAGLIDATAYMDTSIINNNENTQFISAPLVNNPIIDFPDYALGAVIQQAFNDHLFGRLLVSSSHGLADNPARNYSQAFEIGKDDKGMFVDSEVSYQTDINLLTLGLWTHTAPHESLSDPTQTNMRNYGAYLNAYQSFGKHSVEGRLAYTNPKVSSGEVFAALAYEYQRPHWVFGTGYSWTKTSDYITDKRYQNNNQLLELYLRRDFFKSLYITPSLQAFQHPAYNKDEIQLDDTLWSLNLRVSYLF